MKHVARGVLQGRLGKSLALFSEVIHDRRPNSLRVLMYHRVDELDASWHLAPETLSATPAQFDAQMELVRRRFHPVSIHDVCAAIGGEHVLPPRSVLVTFDDAYYDFATYAWPTLQRYEIPVTLFAATSFPGDPSRVFWWDRLHQIVERSGAAGCLSTPFGQFQTATLSRRRAAYRRLVARLRRLPWKETVAFLEAWCDDAAVSFAAASVLDWGELARLRDEGVDIAPHTRSHGMLDRMAVSQVRDEIAGSCDDLRRQLGGYAPALAYPGGFITDEVLAVAREEAIQLAFTTRRGANVIGRSDPYALQRINVGVATQAPLVGMQLSLPPACLHAMARCGG